MPEGKKKLSSSQKEVIRNWIQAGAQTLRPEPENVEEARFTPEELSFWAFQSPRKPPIPLDEFADHVARATNPIDAFVRIKLLSAGLDLSKLRYKSGAQEFSLVQSPTARVAAELLA